MSSGPDWEICIVKDDARQTQVKYKGEVVGHILSVNIDINSKDKHIPIVTFSVFGMNVGFSLKEGTGENK